jgi:hypothetical protein
MARRQQSATTRHPAQDVEIIPDRTSLNLGRRTWLADDRLCAVVHDFAGAIFPCTPKTFNDREQLYQRGVLSAGMAGNTAPTRPGRGALGSSSVHCGSATTVVSIEHEIAPSKPQDLVERGFLITKCEPYIH